MRLPTVIPPEANNTATINPRTDRIPFLAERISTFGSASALHRQITASYEALCKKPLKVAGSS